MTCLLQTLAAETGGRYHRSHGDFNADLFAHKVLKEGFTDEVNIIFFIFSLKIVNALSLRPSNSIWCLCLRLWLWKIPNVTVVVTLVLYLFQTVRIPEFDGDDLRRLASEIALARQYMAQAKIFRDQYNTKKSGTDENAVGKELISNV